MAELRRAVIVGVNNYEDKRLPALGGAVNDAKELREKLHEFGRFEIDEDHFLIESRASCVNIRRAISDLFWKTDRCDLALFYFSGHGLQDGYKNGYLAPQDIRQDEPLVSGIRMDELRSIVVDATAKRNVIVILDCCYSGIATQGERAAPEAGDPIGDCFSSDDSAEANSGWIILGSSGKDEKSREITRRHEIGDSEAHPHGLFTFHLLEGLNGRACDRSGRISLYQLKEYVNSQMQGSKQHKLSFLGAGIGQADDIMVANASELTRLRESLAEGRQGFERNEARALFKCIEKLSQVLRLSPNLEEALQLKRCVDERLVDYRRSANLWLLRHRRTIGEDILDQFSRLEKLASELSFDSLVNEDVDWQNLVLGLCQASESKLDDKVFIAQLSAVRQSRPAALSDRGLPDS
jgi:uncharacterized caspase-like protein